MKKILVGLDGSSREAGVLRAAIALSRKIGAKLVLFRAVGLPAELPAEAFSIPPQDVPKLLESRGMADLKKLAADVPPDTLDKVLVHIGSPWDAVIHAAIAEDVDLIMVGSHGYGTVDRVLGTTAAKIVNHADRSVMVVRAPERLAK